MASEAPPARPSARNLGSLFDLETRDTVSAATGEANGTAQVSDGPGPQWLETPSRDLFGLAFSGGGIRSATFNLGVLQALNRLGLLECFDYFATVSGGGYSGGFWTAWKKRGNVAQLPTGSNGDEGAEIRHLREFSNFLIPRLGLLSYDTGRAVVTLLSSMIPSILASLALMTLAVLAWVLVAWILFSPVSDDVFRSLRVEGYALGGALVAASAVFGMVALRRRRRGRANAQQVSQARTVVALAAALGVGWMGVTALGSFDMNAAMMLGITFIVLAGAEVTWQARGETSPAWSAAAAGMLGMILTSLAWRRGVWPRLDGFYTASQALPAAPASAAAAWRLFGPAVTWAAAAGVFVALRLLVAPWVASRKPLASWRSAADRVQSRLLLLAAAWSVIALLWWAGVALDVSMARAGAESSGAAGLAGVAAALSAVFAKVQHLLGGKKKEGGGTGMMQRLLPYLPKILAYAVLALMAIAVVAAIYVVDRAGYTPWTMALAAGAVTGVALVFLDPNEVGLHAFYRGRLSRAYLGAVNLPGGSRSEEQPGDDFPLADVGEHVRPLHLVCCTANDLAFGHRMANLSRGAVAGVLSRHGFQVGDSWAPWGVFKRGAPTLGSSITASGAAFNTLMGSRSIEYGRGVSYLMATLNLRLGLWLPHPLHACQARGTLLPGLPFYRELFGQARADGWQVHLSDGGHLENTGVYELIRRHCHVIVATDCGMDPAGTFTDLGNLVRRVRIDFGVDIRIDLSPLKPDESGRARQYMVAGDIHYPGGDTGVLLLLKPAMVGGEPADVQQYRSRNPAFPHESTGDQFYSEAQWESYRRLGEHAALSAFEAVVEPAGAGANPLAAWMGTFARARREWQPKPDGYEARLSHFADRVAELDAVLRQPGCERLLAEVYKEVAEVGRSAEPRVAAPGAVVSTPVADDGHGSAGATDLPDGLQPAEADPVAGAIASGFQLAVAAIRTIGRDQPAPDPASAPDEAELTHGLYLLRRVLLLMQEVYETEELERNARHPLYLGVMNWFARWTYAPFFRMWWPLLKALYPQPFTRFLETEFALPTVERGRGLQGDVSTAEDPDGFAISSWLRQGSPRPASDQRVVSFRLRMVYRGEQKYSVQAAQVIVRPERETLVWNAGDFFVAPGLWGIGIGNAFLEKLGEASLDGLAAPGEAPPRFLAVEVRYDAESKKRGADELQLYRGAGFCEAPVENGWITWAGERLVDVSAHAVRPGESVRWMVLPVHAAQPAAATA
jgi:hypothetical protein